MVAQNLKGVNLKRRDFLKLLPYTLGGAFLFSSKEFIFFDKNNRKRYLIPLKSLKEGVNLHKNGEFFIFKKGKKLEVLNLHCTHMGCILRYFNDKKLFICPCHHSKFTKDGKRIEGPAKRDLDKIAFKIVKDNVIIT